METAHEAARDTGRDRSRLALCLSGGGYRATLFHLGAARRPHELGLLGRLETISSVSGGSVFADCVAGQRLRENAPQLMPADPLPAAPPHPEWMDEAKARRALRASHKRISLGRLVARLRGRS
jgi:NTE family protein